jgi:hypothetical protein
MQQRFAAAGGSDGFMWFLPIKEKLEALATITTQMQVVKAQVDEILGISDIVRGVTKASETATAQEIKGRWVGIRLTRKRETVIYTVKAMMRMMAQLLVSHITPENLQRMTQMEITEEMMGIMQDDMMMEFVIDIESDSTVAKDENAERQTFQEMLNGVAQFAQSVMPMVQQNAMPASVSSAILQAALKPYTKYNRNLEEALTQMPETAQQLQGMNKQIQELTQKDQQTGQELQYWKGLAEMLQADSTASKTGTEIANKELKEAQTDKTYAQTAEIIGETKDSSLQPAKTIAEVREINARAENQKRPDNNNGANR